MSNPNQDIIDQLSSISAKLDQGVQIIATDETDNKTPIKITAHNKNKIGTQYFGTLNVNTDISGSVQLNNKTSNILIYGQSGTTNYPVSVETNGKVNVLDTGANSYLGSIDTKLTSTANKLQVQDTAVNNNLNTIINKLDNIITPTRYGSHNNVHSGSLSASSSSSAVDVSLYKKAVISYNDTSYTLNNTLQIIASADAITGDYDYIGLLIPVTNTTTSKRYASAILELGPFKYLKIINLSDDAISGISCSLYGNS